MHIASQLSGFYYLSYCKPSNDVFTAQLMNITKDCADREPPNGVEKHP